MSKNITPAMAKWLNAINESTDSDFFYGHFYDNDVCHTDRKRKKFNAGMCKTLKRAGLIEWKNIDGNISLPRYRFYLTDKGREAIKGKS